MWPEGCVLCYVLGTLQAACVLCLCWKHPINHWLQSSVILVQSLNAVSSSLPRVTETTLLSAVTHHMWYPDPLACSNRAIWDQGKLWLAFLVQERLHNVLTHYPLYNRWGWPTCLQECTQSPCETVSQLIGLRVCLGAKGWSLSMSVVNPPTFLELSDN